MLHHEHYDMSRYMSNERALHYLYELRKKTVPVYSHSYAGKAPESERKS
jgi:hypothetical protein